ncbi:MAG: Trigger factor [Candidatus Roizmanbacteria bacterium GW2011_GWA2_35_8]|uniref:Trigger factor n=1 Tax=Candidatus Roizmanbacteria bacterium GW2011_GWA2_35_8 TaxID=1618479 RepID=A0A0G0G402_9BACT|nr:MAG: Trigger factor [Candidatus Roizmanbacteria bacterium GW2011_GWA2_35_8]
MYTHKVKKLPKNTIEISVTLPRADIKKGKDEAFFRLQKELTVEGFRKGKVPVPIAEKHLSAEAIYQEMMKVTLPKIYDEILHKESLKPIMSPKIELASAKDNEDWQIRITVAERPQVELGKYKEKIKELKANNKKANIWVPGQDKEKKDDEAEKSKFLNVALEALLKTAKIEISDLILEEELNHRLTRLIDDVQKIGLTIDSYLKSKNLTMDSIKDQYKREIEDTYKLEFLLSEIADKENIKVENSDIEKLFLNIKDDKEREKAKENSYYYASILRKKKTIDFLISL